MSEAEIAGGPERRRDLHVAAVPGRRIVVLGTAHVSQESVELVRQVIEEERPDGVCVELDERRYEALSQPERFDALDLREVIRARQLETLLLNLVLAAYQRRIGLELGVKPGAEQLEAARAAERVGAALHFCDRDVRVTLRRAFRSLSLWQKLMLFSTGVAGMLERPEIDEQALRELREQDVLSSLLAELGREFPLLKNALIDERDAYLAERIRATPGERLVAVLGAGHVQGVLAHLSRGAGADLAELDRMPPPSRVWRVVGWAIPALIVGSLLWIGLRQGAGEATANLAYWVVANGVPCALGAVIALGHPATVLAGFVAAPITSLTPLIGAGYVTAFVQAWLRPPLVRELPAALDDAARVTGWWRNRLLRVLLVFVLTTVGSLIGTWVGGVEILRNAVR